MHKLENSSFSPPHPCLTPSAHGSPSEFLDETYLEKTRGMGLLYGENCMILPSTIFDWSTRVIDWQTHGRTDGIATAYSALSIHAVARNKTENTICCTVYISFIKLLDLDWHQNLITGTWSLAVALPLQKFHSVHNFFSNLVDRQTDRHKSITSYLLVRKWTKCHSSYQQWQFYEGQHGTWQHLSENIWLPSHSLQMLLETQTLVQVDNYTHTDMHIVCI